MKKLILLISFILIALATAQDIENFQFTDLDGNSYDLYEILDRGTYVYVYAVSNG